MGGVGSWDDVGGARTHRNRVVPVVARRSRGDGAADRRRVDRRLRDDLEHDRHHADAADLRARRRFFELSGGVDLARREPDVSEFSRAMISALLLAVAAPFASAQSFADLALSDSPTRHQRLFGAARKEGSLTVYTSNAAPTIT